MSPVRPELTVVTCNAYVLNRRLGALRRRLRATRAHLIFAQEAARLGKVKGYVRFSAPAGIDRDAGEVAVYLRSDVAQGYLEHRAIAATRDVGKPGGVARDRYIVVVLFRFCGRTFGAYGTHANAGVMGDGSGPLADRPASRANEILTTRMLDAIVADEIDHNVIPITGADWNATRRNTGPGTPTWLHTAAAMTYVSFGIDGIGYATEHLTLRGKGDTSAPGSNHDLGIVRLGVTHRN